MRIILASSIVLIIFIGFLAHQTTQKKPKQVVQDAHSIMLKETDFYLFCKDNIKDCQVHAQESKVFTDENRITCKDITCKLTTKHGSTAILKAPRAFINNNTKHICLPDTVTGSFKTWNLKKQDVSYDANEQLIKAEKTELYSNGGISITAQKSTIDLEDETLHLYDGVCSNFVQK